MKKLGDPRAVEPLIEVTKRALQVLEKYGDASAIPALEDLLGKLQGKYQEEGYTSEYIQTATYGGRVDNRGTIEWVDKIIRTGKKDSDRYNQTWAITTFSGKKNATPLICFLFN